METEQELCMAYDKLAEAAEQQRDMAAWERGEGPPPNVSLVLSAEGESYAKGQRTRTSQEPSALDAERKEVQ